MTCQLVSSFPILPFYVKMGWKLEVKRFTQIYSFWKFPSKLLFFFSVSYLSLLYHCRFPALLTTLFFLSLNYAVLSLLLSLIRAGNKPPPATPGKPKKATTFQEFESITSDAWDVGDDDDELLAMAAQNLNIEVVMETANKVRARCKGVVVKKLSDGALNTT